MKNQKNSRKKSNLLPIAAAVVVVVAAAMVIVPKLLPKEEAQADTQKDTPAAALSEDGAAVVIDTAALSGEALFYDYDADGVTVELFAVKASDGSVRLALNTCQVCNGSPYAYFVQNGDYFICQNCGNRFASTQVGLVSGGCNPVPITQADYELRDGMILVPTEFLTLNAARFRNWKNF